MLLFQVMYSGNLICLYPHLVLDDIGSLPYALARPMLLKVDNPEKLVSGTYPKNSCYTPLYKESC